MKEKKGTEDLGEKDIKMNITVFMNSKNNECKLNNNAFENVT